MSLDSLLVVGIDPSLRNWATVLGAYDLHTKTLKILETQLTSTKKETNKRIRVNSSDLVTAEELYKSCLDLCSKAKVIFAEIPVGSQSARAMASYGVCIGVLGSLRGTGIPIQEVMPKEVKKAAVGSATATKKQMIDWAMSKHPEADWPKHGGKVTEGKAEHIADAIASIYAGIQTPVFKQLIHLHREI